MRLSLFSRRSPDQRHWGLQPYRWITASVLKFSKQGKSMAHFLARTHIIEFFSRSNESLARLTATYFSTLFSFFPASPYESFLSSLISVGVNSRFLCHFFFFLFFSLSQTPKGAPSVLSIVTFDSHHCHPHMSSRIVRWLRKQIYLGDKANALTDKFNLCNPPMTNSTVAKPSHVPMSPALPIFISNIVLE